jgi:hypothetical protein
MKSAILRPMERVFVGCVWAGALAAVACADGPAAPTSPTASPAVVSLPATVPGNQATVPQAIVTTEAPSGFSHIRPLLLTKTCDAIDHCTVITAEAGPIPVGTGAFYTGPLLENRTTSGVVLTTPSGDTATGHCSLNYKTGLGTCAFTSGTGELAGFHANVKVTSDFESNPAGVFTWSGTYHLVKRD